jgi:hypothetical protein
MREEGKIKEQGDLIMSLHHLKTTRISIDLPFDEHVHLKITCARHGIPIRQFVVDSIEKNLKEYEDQLDEQAYDVGKREIKKYGTISLGELDRSLGYNVRSQNQRATGKKIRKNPSKRLRKDKK